MPSTQHERCSGAGRQPGGGDRKLAIPVFLTTPSTRRQHRQWWLSSVRQGLRRVGGDRASSLAPYLRFPGSWHHRSVPLCGLQVNFQTAQLK